MFQNSVMPTTADIPHGLPHAGLPQTLRRVLRDVPLPRSAREYLAWVLMMTFIAGLITLQIWFSMKMAEAEQTVVELSSAYTRIDQENAELLWQISQFTHLERIKIEANRMGYGPSLNREYRWVQPDLLLTVPAMSPAAEAAATAGQPDFVQHIDAMPADELPWYSAYWQTIQTWWQPDDASVGVMWQQ